MTWEPLAHMKLCHSLAQTEFNLENVEKKQCDKWVCVAFLVYHKVNVLFLVLLYYDIFVPINFNTIYLKKTRKNIVATHPAQNDLFPIVSIPFSIKS